MTQGLGKYLNKIFCPSADYEAIHEVKNWAKVRSILRSLLDGKDVPAIVVYLDCYALNGTHRLAANEIAKRLGYRCRVPIVDVEDFEDSETLIELFETGDFIQLDEILDRYKSYT